MPKGRRADGSLISACEQPWRFNVQHVGTQLDVAVAVDQRKWTASAHNHAQRHRSGCRESAEAAREPSDRILERPLATEECSTLSKVAECSDCLRSVPITDP